MHGNQLKLLLHITCANCFAIRLTSFFISDDTPFIQAFHLAVQFELLDKKCNKKDNKLTHDTFLSCVIIKNAKHFKNVIRKYPNKFFNHS